MDATVSGGFLTAGDNGTTEVAVTVGWGKDEIVPGSFVADWPGFGGISGTIGPEGYSGIAPSGGTRDYLVTVGPAQIYGTFGSSVAIFDFFENPAGSGSGSDFVVARGADPDVTLTISQEPSFFAPATAVDATADIVVSWPGWTDPRGFATYSLDWGVLGAPPVTGSFAPADGLNTSTARGMPFGTFNVRLTVSSPGDQVYYDHTIIFVAVPTPGAAPLAWRQRHDGAATPGPTLAQISATGGDRPTFVWRQQTP